MNTGTAPIMSIDALRRAISEMRRTEEDMLWYRNRGNTQMAEACSFQLYAQRALIRTIIGSEKRIES